MGKYCLLTLAAFSSTFTSCFFLFFVISHLGDSGITIIRSTISSKFGADSTKKIIIKELGSGITIDLYNFFVNAYI